MVLLSFGSDYGLSLRRAPDARQACAQGWGAAHADTPESVASLRELLALVSAHEWAKKGVEVPALGAPPLNRIYPRYGVFSPVRGEYVALVAQAPLPAAPDTLLAFDIGTGTGVLSAVLARRGVSHVVATDLDARALACAHTNLERLGVGVRPPWVGDAPAQSGADDGVELALAAGLVGLAVPVSPPVPTEHRQVELEPRRERDVVPGVVQLLRTDLFPPGRADLVVCNPPWLPARATSPVEHAVYDEGSRMLRGFLAGLAGHLAPGGEGWLIMSDLAERLGLRAPTELADWIAAAGLRVADRLDAKPLHPKAADATDPLHAARSAEVTSLWRLVAVDDGSGPAGLAA